MVLGWMMATPILLMAILTMSGKLLSEVCCEQTKTHSCNLSLCGRSVSRTSVSREMKGSGEREVSRAITAASCGSAL